jgi:hypothetical protein
LVSAAIVLRERKGVAVRACARVEYCRRAERRPDRRRLDRRGEPFDQLMPRGIFVNVRLDAHLGFFPIARESTSSARAQAFSAAETRLGIKNA